MAAWAAWIASRRIIKAIRAERGDDKVLLLDGGDTWQGSWTSLQTKGQDMVDVMTALKVDAMVAHWEFTYGAERVKEIAEEPPFAFLAQNVRSHEWQEPVFEARKMFERGGAKIAVIGQAFPAHGRSPIRAGCSPSGNSACARRICRSRSMKPAPMARMSSCCSRTTASTSTASWRRRVKGIDIILTAHTHDAMPGVVKVGETILIASGVARQVRLAARSRHQGQEGRRLSATS